MRELVRRTGGEVRLEDAPGGGLLVHVVLPRATDATSTDAATTDGPTTDGPTADRDTVPGSG